MTRSNQVLTEEAQADREDFNSMDYGGCSCCISPPCNFCLHPGNPRNQDEFDECWEFESIEGKLEDLRARLHKQIEAMK